MEDGASQDKWQQRMADAPPQLNLSSDALPSRALSGHCGALQAVLPPGSIGAGPCVASTKATRGAVQAYRSLDGLGLVGSAERSTLLRSSTNTKLAPTELCHPLPLERMPLVPDEEVARRALPPPVRDRAASACVAPPKNPEAQLQAAAAASQQRPMAAGVAAWQERERGEGVWAAEAVFWRQQLACAPLLLELPTDRPRPLRLGGRAGSVKMVSAPGVTARLEALAASSNVTLFTVVLAAWKVLPSSL